MIGKYAAIAAIGALCVAGHASAKDGPVAQLSALKGSVMVSQGGKMVPATVGALAAGDRVIVSKGSAKLEYADGCVTTVPANGMATIGAASPCASGSGLVNASQGSSAQLFEGSTGTYAAIGAFLIGTAVVVSAADDDDDDDGDSVSP